MTIHSEVVIGDGSKVWFWYCRWSDTAVARASDDFYPKDPASSKPHISTCTFIGLFLAPLVQPDWDMFHRYTTLYCSADGSRPTRFSPRIKHLHEDLRAYLTYLYSTMKQNTTHI